ncbi:MAG: J domain-containing protein [Pseudomonadota bacterium]
MGSDPYKILGLDRGASADAIRSAYRKLAKELHPDRNPGDAAAEDRFKQVSAAFDILGDADKRAKFDRGEIDADGNERGPAFRGGGGRGPFPGGEGGFEDVNDLFADLFGGRRGGGFNARGADMRYQLGVDFAEAALGVKKRVTMPDGRNLNIAIPAGLRDGQTLRLRGQGAPGRGDGPPGDVYVEASVKPHAFFERVGDDIHLEAPITLKEAVMGGKITVPTIDGEVALSVPEGCSSGAVLRLRGKGVKPASGKPPGDQYVKLKIVLPTPIDKDLKDFAKKWRGADAQAPRAAFEAKKEKAAS